MTDTEGHFEEHGLRSGAIGLGGDLVAAVVNVAPSSSVAFTLALLVGFSGTASPLAVLLCGLGMVFCALGYARLNRWRASAGAAYLWVGAAINPVIGVGTGLLSILTCIVSNTANVTLAGAYALYVIFNTHSASSFFVWLMAGAIVGLMLWVAITGLKLSVRVQLVLMAIEYSVIVSFVILALIHEARHTGGATLPSLSDFKISTSFGGFKGLAESAVIAAFLYGSWETPSALGEESTNSKFNPGRAMILGTVFLTVWYTFLIAVFQGISGRTEVLAHGSDILAYAGTVLASGAWSRLLPFAVLMAVVGTTQMQMIQPSRIAYSLSRDELLPKFLKKIHRTHRTPWAALVVLAAIPITLLIPYLASSGLHTAINDLVGATGMLYLFMYFLVAVSSVWFYRTQLTRSFKEFLIGGLLPLVGGLFLLVLFIYGLTTQAKAVAVVSAVGIVLVYVLAIVIKRVRPNSPFFTAMEELRNSPEDVIFSQDGELL
jgi:amino acid transporter